MCAQKDVIGFSDAMEERDGKLFIMNRHPKQ